MSSTSGILRSGYVAVAGLANSGKSALVNALTGRNICPSHEHPGMTRIPVTSIYSNDTEQICLIDTPPLELDWRDDLVGGLDLICLTLNSNELSDQLESRVTCDFIARRKDVPILLVPTFMDFLPARLHSAVVNQVSMSQFYDEIVPVSAPCGLGVADLRSVVSRYVPERRRLFPEGCFSLHSERFLVSERIRYSLFCALPTDIAAATAVQIEEFSIRDEKRYVRANLYVSRHSSKGVVIGRKGAMLQHISRIASESASRIVERPLYLDLWVKVRESWPDNRRDLMEFGYIC